MSMEPDLQLYYQVYLHDLDFCSLSVIYNCQNKFSILYLQHVADPLLKKASEYDKEISQSHNADKPTAP